MKKIFANTNHVPNSQLNGFFTSNAINILGTRMTSEAWTFKSTHGEWYYFRLQITTRDIPDANTWKLAILKCLQQSRGVFGQSIEFDIMASSEISNFETVVRVHFQDRTHFAECISMGTFDDSTNGDASIRILAQSASLQGLVTGRTNWDI